MNDQRLISFTRRLLQRIHMVAVFRHSAMESVLSGSAETNARLFLSAYTLTYNPTRLLQTTGPLENALKEISLNLLAQFKKICDCIQSNTSFQGMPNEMPCDFMKMFLEYKKQYCAWRNIDQKVQIEKLERAFVTLTQAHNIMPPEERESSALGREFLNQIEIIRSKLRRFGGEESLRKVDEIVRLSPTRSSIDPTVDNEFLAHELALNSAFRFKDDDNHAMLQTTPDTFDQAFWDSLPADFQKAPPSYRRLLCLLRGVRDELKGSTPSTRELNMDRVNVCQIIQQVKDGVYSQDKSMRLIESVVEEVIKPHQAPARIEQTQTLLNEALGYMATADPLQALCAGLRFLMNRAKAMRVDFLNTQVQAIAGIIVCNTPYYERELFQCKLNEGSITLERTVTWIRNTILKSGLRQGVDETINLHTNIRLTAMFYLLVNKENITADNCPETLRCDLNRINDMRRELSSLTIATTMLLAVHHFANENPEVADHWPQINKTLTSWDSELNVEHAVTEVEDIVSGISADKKKLLVDILKRCSLSCDLLNYAV